MSLLHDSSPYTLVICEKPDAAERVAEALSEKELNITKYGNIKTFILKRSGRTYVICSAIGHLYTVSSPFQKRYVYPVFDVGWFPIHMIDLKRKYISQRIAIIKKLAENADVFINACDFDQEGETIGFNILKYACNEKQTTAFRAKFSTLTKTDIQEAFRTTVQGLGIGLAKAGRTRHIVDFIFGINLSRALSESFHKFNQGYRAITIGRVQGPVLSYVINREVEIRTFVPTPFWRLHAELAKADSTIIAAYEKKQVLKISEAQNIKKRCRGKKGVVTKVTKSKYNQFPPFPLNLGDLQKCAYQAFGFIPSQTLRISERLYLNALISYPRTSSQKLPPSIDYLRILKGLQRDKVFNKDATEVLHGKMIPNQGPKNDPAHPAIYPTGDISKHVLSSSENKLYDLIVRRFFAVFGEVAKRERISVTVDIDGYLFNTYGKQTLCEGWLKFYRKYVNADDKLILHLVENDELSPKSLVMEEKFTQPPRRYDQCSLLEKMEQENIGTKTTRANIIKTLCDRGYFSGTSIFATDIAFAVFDIMKQYSPEIISVEMTRKIEDNLDKIERSKMDEEIVIHQAVDQIMDSLFEIKKAEQEIGGKLGQAVIKTIHKQHRLNSCPICKKGFLIIIRSKKTNKRFVGCSGYNAGCRASAPLPQNGTVTSTGKTCSSCGWPIVNIRFKRKSTWRLCTNTTCISKKMVKKDEM